MAVGGGRTQRPTPMGGARARDSERSAVARCRGGAARFRAVRVAVLNGVNLDVLAMRNPALYGNMSLTELETSIYRWAAELGITVQIRQTNHEGQYVEWCHDALDWADGVIANPAAWSHYSSRSATPSSSSPSRWSRCTCRTSRSARRGAGTRSSPTSPPNGSSARGRRATGKPSPSSRALVSGRLDRLRAVLEEPFLVTNPVNLRYLTGIDSDNAGLLVEPDQARFFTDFRYVQAAKEVGNGRGRADLPKPARGPRGAPVRPRRVRGGHDDVRRLRDARSGRARAGSAPHGGAGLARSRRRVSSSRSGVRPRSRARRRPARRADVRRRTERDLADWIEATFRELGGVGLSYDSIVASGSNGALPHAVPGDRVIGEGETIVIDASPMFGGYCCDCTRTFATGDLPEELRRAYDATKAAQAAGLEAIRPGTAARDADTAARRVIEEAGFGEAFGHGLGHGVGLVVHELPFLNQDSEESLAAGNVATCEPGIYLAGLGGIRIEDLVIVTEDGQEILTTTTKELVIVR